MDTIFLGIALFLIYFCLASCVLYERKDSVTHPPNNSQPIEQAVREMLDEIYGEVTICGMTYSAGAALEACDPVAFRCGLSDYESEIQGELEEAIENEDDSEIEWAEEE